MPAYTGSAIVLTLSTSNEHKFSLLSASVYLASAVRSSGFGSARYGVVYASRPQNGYSPVK